MALIGTIRKNFWFVLILLGFALAAFILMDMTSAGNAGGAGSALTMGSVGGEKIDYRAFQQAEQSYYRNAQGDAFAKRKTIWDFFVENALIKKEASALGMNVSKDELMDLQFGANQSQIIQQNWRNPQTGQIDQASLQQFKTVIENEEDMNPEFRAYWAEQEKQIIKESLQSKLNSLVSKSVYTPNWMAEESHILDNTKVDFNYVKIPFDNIDGTGIEVSDADLLSFAQAKGEKYVVNEETREVEFATYTVSPSAADTVAVSEKVGSMRAEFAKSEGDSLYVLSQNGTYSHIYGGSDEMPANAKEAITSLNPGEIYGPFTTSGISMMVKMLDKRSIPDSVEARHILIGAGEANPGSYDRAYVTIDSIRRAYRSGTSFDTLALRHSTDSSNNRNGGSLGSFDQRRMVPEFASAAFTGKKGGLYTVKTSFGVHLLEVQRQVFGDGDNTKYRIASIAQPITPSQETQDLAYDRVTEILSKNKDLASLKAAVEAEPNMTFTKSAPLRKNDYSVGALGSDQSSREIVQWAFDLSSETGDISPEIYKFTDKVNYFDSRYVIAGLTSIIPQGMPPASSLRNTLATAVLNKKKAEKFAAGMSYNSLQEVASQNGVAVETAADVGYKASVITGIGNEQDVLANAHGLAVQSVSKPIVGQSGLFIVQPISRQEAGAATNLQFIKGNVTNATKSQIDFSLIKNMIKRADIKDDRSTFF